MSAEEGEHVENGAAFDWAEQAQAMTRAWTTAQAQLWSDWTAAVQPAAAAGASLAGDWMKQWQTLAANAMRGWTAGSDETSGEVATRLLTGEQAFLSFVDMAFGMLRAVAPKIDAGEDWRELVRRYLGQLREDMLSGQSLWTTPGDTAATAGDVTELWRLYSLELQRFFGPWGTAYRDAALNFAEAGRGDPAAIHRTFAGFLDAYELTFGRFVSAPSVGYTRESTERVLRGFDAWVEMNRAAMDFQTELASTGVRAVEALMSRLVEMGEKGESITTLRAFFDLWVDTVEKSYYELFGSESFATLQGRYVNASLLYRRRQGELLDELMETVGLPGRKEVDQIHHHVYDLRIELRWVKREMRALRRQLAAQAAALDESGEGQQGAASAEAGRRAAKAAGRAKKPAAKARGKARAKASPPAAEQPRRPAADDPETSKP